jgi:hypothetical protein
MRWTSRLAGFPIYYSYVAPPRNEDDILIAGTTGQWYILYYVLTWQRWLIADAREGAAHGGLSFLGDTLDELISALHRAGPHSVARDDTTYTTSWHFQVFCEKRCGRPRPCGSFDADEFVRLAYASCLRAIGWRARRTNQ